MTATTSFAPTRRPYRLPPVLHYTLHSTYLTARNVSFVVFSFSLPVIMYVLFSQMFGTMQTPSGVNYSALIMVSMGSYGALGAAMSGGAYLAVERKSGWFRQLGLTALPSRAFLWAKSAVIMILVLPSVLMVYLAGLVVGGVRAPIGDWLASIGLIWLALIPLTVLGIVVGVWVKTEAVGGVTTMLLLVLAMLGGLWMPVELMPEVLQSVATVLPSYWVGQLGRYPFLPDGTPFPWIGLFVLACWAVAMTVAGGLGYRRAVATSKR